ncbi:MAG: hypothetical protein MHPSP_002679 [Paramarteilia canceri]
MSASAHLSGAIVATQETPSESQASQVVETLNGKTSRPYVCNLVLIRDVPTNAYLDDMKEILQRISKVHTIRLFPSDQQIG